MWETMLTAAQAEFSDLADPADMTRAVMRLFLAAVLAGVVGYDRERHGSSAGLRTHMIVALGVALLVVTADLSGMDEESVSRVIQGIFAGIGFLGAGAILKQAGNDRVIGLTTAASLWTTAAIATAAGLGREGTAVMGTAFAFIILSVLLRFEQPDAVQRSERDRG